jgi:hypothetical protein
MTPKEKAEELVLKFKQLPQEGTIAWYLSFELSKQCALIAVDEILSVIWINLDDEVDYWAEVKQEIEKL